MTVIQSCTLYEKLYYALTDEAVLRFVMSSYQENYNRFFSKKVPKIGQMIQTAFQLLADSQKEGFDVGKLTAATDKINETTFHTGRNEIFYQEYIHYKRSHRPKYEFEKMKRWLDGKTILDFGSGAGYFAAELTHCGYNIKMADILDYRDSESLSIPFCKMDSPVHVNFPDKSFDIVLCDAVLHHIYQVNISAALRELKRVSNTLLIEEDVYDVPASLTQEIIKTQTELTTFVHLTPEQQYMALVLSDFFSNAIAYEKDMNLPFTFQTVEQWRNTIQKSGYTVIEEQFLGFEQDRVTPQCRMLFLCEVA